MPKNKKPAGGRAAKNFEPRYGEKKGSFQDRKRRTDAPDARSQKPGSKSPGHRGYRAEQATEAPAKRRWTSQERAGRDEARGIRTHGAGDRPRYDRDARPARDDRSFDRSARPARDDRAPRRDVGGRPAQGERPRYDRDARPARDDRAPRRDDRRPAQGERPRYDRDARPARDDRAPRRQFDDRPARDDRRPAQGERARYDRDARPARTDRDTRAPRLDRVDRDDRRSFGDARPSYRRDDRVERPRYDRDARPARDDRAPRRDFGDRPAGGDRAPRRDQGARPNRADWNAKPSRSTEHDQRVDVVHERLQAQAITAGDVADVTFGDLGLGENIVRTLADLGAQSPFPIQAATIPAILEGRDVLARGRTGSGKTIAFGAPLVESILRSQSGKRREFGRNPRAIILAPTRELALQIDRTIQPIARSVGLFTTQIYGGVPQGRQVGALKKGVDIVIGTPGRIEDLMNQGKLDLSSIEIAVLDEADHMCDLGFLEGVQTILRATADGSQKLLFSATLDREVAALVDEFLVEPAVHEVAGEDQDSSTIDHRILVIEHRDKAEILDSLVSREGKTLVFARTRAYAEMLAEQFEDAGINAVALHGDLNQAKRTRNLERLTSGRVNVLVATDVAARGIHVDDIDLVVQADAPDEYKTYLHRSGRTGRAGRSGTVVTLITRQRRRRMAEMLDRAEIDAPFEEVRIGDDLLEELSGRQLSNVDA
ncbi:DEAD/DEAH box helicase [Microbacterium sp.]|uniref:DEAD/DEAH box helicase n=1 Tax=Microbacterium sp. TaxID=51671 RepID=UPI003F7240EF